MWVIINFEKNEDSVTDVQSLLYSLSKFWYAFYCSDFPVPTSLSSSTLLNVTLYYYALIDKSSSQPFKSTVRSCTACDIIIQCIAWYM